MAAASTLWSANAHVTVQRAVALGVATLFGIYLATRFDRRTQLRVFGWTFGMAAVLSLAVSVMAPDLGVTTGVHDGAWRGIYANKNMLGRLCTLGATVHVLRALATHRRRWGAWAAAALCGLLTILSRSATAVVVLATLLLLLPLFRTLRWRASLRLAALIGAVLFGGALAVLLVAQADLALSLVGRDATLSGRTHLWHVVGWFILRRPWLGYGYGAFWANGSPTAALVVRAIRWNAPHAHDTFLDVALDLGVVGLALFVLGMLVAARRAIAAYRETADPAELWPLLLLAYLALFSITDTIMLRQNHLIWVLYVASIALPAPTGRELPLQARARTGRHAVSIGVRVRQARRALLPDRLPFRS
jgi:O-antigen ligase